MTLVGAGWTSTTRGQDAEPPVTDAAEDLRYLDEEADDDDLFVDPELPDTRAPRAILLEPAGLSVLPIISYGIGLTHEVGTSSMPLLVRARYARGSATMGQRYAVSELTSVELVWSFHKWLFLGVGPAYRHVRSTLGDAMTGQPDVSSSASTGAVSVVFGLERPLGSYLLGSDMIGIVQPLGGVRRRGAPYSESGDRDPHANTLERAGTGRSLSVLRVYFGPRF